MPEEIVRVNEANQKSDRLEKQVATPADFTSPEVLYEDLIQEIRKYHPSSDLSDIERAYKIARDAHEGQKRKSGEPYIIHPLCVAIILAELELDKETIIAGLLHDVVEDTVMTSEDVTREFGAEVALLVDGVTKLTQLNYQHDKIEVQAENLRKMFLAMAKDIRVILIKLADRCIICGRCSIRHQQSRLKNRVKRWKSMHRLHIVLVFPRLKWNWMIYPCSI